MPVPNFALKPPLKTIFLPKLGMGTMESLLEMIFGRKQKEEEPTLREAQDIVEGEISREEKALCEFASKKFAEIRYLISSLSKNSEELEKHEIKVDEGNKTYPRLFPLRKRI